MHRRQRTFAELLTRSLATAGLLYALIFAYAVPASLLDGANRHSGYGQPDVSALTQAADRPAWKRAHADRFPGCVAVTHWGESDIPSTVVVVRSDGDVRRMPFDEAYRRATSTSKTDDVFAIGACR